MRIVGGKWRGRALSAPEGRGTRPTTDRTRESMASMVLSAFDLDLSGARVLDAFAGSGAIGLEMLSRGALSCTFVERDRKASGVVRANVKALGATAARVQVGDVLQLAERGVVQGGPFALVLLDPPYALDAAVVSHLVESLRASGQLTDDAVVLYEHAADAPDLALAGCEVLKSKARGTTAVTLLRLQSQEGSES
jgi:16S rRNA (guanine966-N2)-methyltransferase